MSGVSYRTICHIADGSTGIGMPPRVFATYGGHETRQGPNPLTPHLCQDAGDLGYIIVDSQCRVVVAPVYLVMR